MIEIDNKIDEIKNLYMLIQSVKTKKREVLEKKLEMELDFFIDRIEDYYYKYVIKNKKIDKLKNDMERTIYNSKNMLDKFMPYMLLYSVNNELSH